MSREDEWTQRDADARQDLKYAYIQVSDRKFRIIQLDTIGYSGEQYTPTVRFKFVSGNLSYGDMDRRLLAYIRGERKPEDDQEQEP